MRSLADATLSAEERHVLERLIAAMDDELDLRAVWLYGSRARAEQPLPESDVDVLVVTAGGWADLGRVTRLLHRVAGEENADPTAFAVQVRDPDWVRSRRAIDSFFMREVDRDKVVLYGDA